MKVLVSDLDDKKDEDRQAKEESGDGVDTDNAAGQDMHHQPKEESGTKIMPTVELMFEHVATRRWRSLFLIAMPDVQESP